MPALNPPPGPDENQPDIVPLPVPLPRPPAPPTMPPATPPGVPPATPPTAPPATQPAPPPVTPPAAPPAPPPRENMLPPADVRPLTPEERAEIGRASGQSNGQIAESEALYQQADAYQQEMIDAAYRKAHGDQLGPSRYVESNGETLHGGGDPTLPNHPPPPNDPDGPPLDPESIMQEPLRPERPPAEPRAPADPNGPESIFSETPVEGTRRPGDSTLPGSGDATVVEPPRPGGGGAGDAANLPPRAVPGEPPPAPEALPEAPRVAPEAPGGGVRPAPAEPAAPRGVVGEAVDGAGKVLLVALIADGLFRDVHWLVGGQEHDGFVGPALEGTWVEEGFHWLGENSPMVSGVITDIDGESHTLGAVAAVGLFPFQLAELVGTGLGIAGAKTAEAAYYLVEVTCDTIVDGANVIDDAVTAAGEWLGEQVVDIFNVDGRHDEVVLVNGGMAPDALQRLIAQVQAQAQAQADADAAAAAAAAAAAQPPPPPPPPPPDMIMG